MQQLQLRAGVERRAEVQEIGGAAIYPVVAPLTCSELTDVDQLFVGRQRGYTAGVVKCV